MGPDDDGQEQRPMDNKGNSDILENWEGCSRKRRRNEEVIKEMEEAHKRSSITVREEKYMENNIKQANNMDRNLYPACH
ncbi:hypothetical protein KPH14_008349 [Odynerus spinipes]|uniref:Uncharacterized protein n=1 Tax=Odynerus spinipes TaxID=1348599 RepID=A0AAD9RFV4_9HYME|nr:hypothetical protein KPH14_008349 [Odynerus spinipes]